jgi:hypothetical protein
MIHRCYPGAHGVILNCITKQLEGLYWDPDTGYKIPKQETCHVGAPLVVKKEFIFCLHLPEVYNFSLQIIFKW